MILSQLKSNLYGNLPTFIIIFIKLGSAKVSLTNNEYVLFEQDEQFVDPEHEQEQFEESTPPVQKSWASLFHSDSKSSLDGSRSAKPLAMIHPYTSGSEKSGASGHDALKNDLGSSVTLGKRESEMAAFLKTYVLNHKAQPLKPRGLSNRSNWCFVNAIMQALVACPPFYNMVSPNFYTSVPA